MVCCMSSVCSSAGPFQQGTGVLARAGRHTATRFLLHTGTSLQSLLENEESLIISLLLYGYSKVGIHSQQGAREKT